MASAMDIDDDALGDQDDEPGMIFPSNPDLDTSSVLEARTKLDDLLQQIAERNEANLSPSVESTPEKLIDTILTPSKRAYTPRGSRKRRKKETGLIDYGDQNRQSYIIKLFDRSIDLAQFDSDTSLYVMMRAWMSNKPFSVYTHDYTTEDTDDDTNDRRATMRHEMSRPTMESEGTNQNHVYFLPRPTKLEEASYPRPLPPALKTQRLEDVINSGTDMNDLIKENTMRWRKVKTRWREHSFRTQERYKDSLKVLKDLYTPP